MNSILRRGVLGFALLLGLPVLAAPITATLSIKPKVTMAQLAQNVQNPESNHYGRFYEPAEIRQLAAPSDAEYNDLIAGLKSEGFSIVSESPTHLWISVSNDKAVYESIFATQIQNVGGARKQMSAAHVPYHLSLIESVTGLDNTRKAHFHYRPALHPGGGIQQSTIKAAYGFNPIYAAGINGKGIDISIATYDGFNVDNVKTFYTQSNLSPMPTVDQVVFNGAPVYKDTSAGETELDAEFSGMIAPGVSVHVFASSTNDDAGELQMYTAILDDNRAKIVNYSWGSCETQVTVQHKTEMEKVFARAVAQGVNITIASGDSGSDSCGDNTNKPDWPSAAPYVVSVGGTTFMQSGGKIAETGWDGSGGGISDIWGLPNWQQGLGGLFVRRSYPDVAFNADPRSGQAIYTGSPGAGMWMVVGGTSMSAPQWAGFLALVGQARQLQGKADIGFINPIIYSMSPATRAATFHDVTQGKNGLYQAGPGWDAVTGWGSMQADALLDYLKTL